MQAQPSIDWAVVAAEMCAERLSELAEELGHEASRGGDGAVGLAIAANVLRDRAFELLADTVHARSRVTSEATIARGAIAVGQS